MSNSTNKILIVGSECQPFIASGGLADVIGSLPQELIKRRKSSYDIRVVLPLYGSISEEWRKKMTFVANAQVQLSWRKQYCGIFTLVENDITYYFLDNEYYFKRVKLYGYFDDAERFAFFSKSVLEILPVIDFYPNIIHANDWQTALISIYLKYLFKDKLKYQNIKTIFTIHNIEYQGKYRYDEDIVQDVFGLSMQEANVAEYDGMINLMKGAMECSNLISTVSPSYAIEIKEPYYSHGLHYVVQQNSDKVVGILNGIDYSFYNPATDKALFVKYDIDSVDLKLQNKIELQKLLNLPVDDKIPMIAMVTRLVSHKGIDLVKGVMNEILSLPLQLVILGTGDSMYENALMEFEHRNPNKLKAIIAYNVDLSRKIYAGADIFLMPSLTEPCGLSQMIASRYGTVPIVRETGGLADSIKDIGNSSGGNGYTFLNYNAHEMLHRIEQAVADYQKKELWNKQIKSVMSQDFSWAPRAKEYIQMYQKLL
jgi:starch synthase